MSDWRVVFYASSLTFSTILSLVVFLLLYRRRKITGAIQLAFLVASVAIWSITTAFEAVAVTLEEKVLWSKLAYIGIVSTGPWFLLFALEYTSTLRRNSRWLMMAIWIFPVITLVMTFTNEYHHLIWSDFEWIAGSTILIYHHGIGFYVNIIYIYLLTSIAAGALIINAVRNRYVYRKQSITLLIGVPIPIIWNILYILGLSPLEGFDLTPVAFSLTGLIIAWGIYRTKLFDLSPLDSEFIIENLGDGVIILDSQNRIVEINPAALTLFDVSAKSCIGNDLFGVIPLLQHRNILERQTVPLIAEVELQPGMRYLEFQTHKLFDKNKVFIGQAIILRDITTRKNVEIALRESEQRYQELIEQAALPVIIVDQRTMEILFHNRRAATLLDMNNRYNHGIKIEKYFLVKSDLQQILDQIQKRGLISEFEAQMTTQIGRMIWVVISANMTHYENRQCLGLSFNDITSRKLVEESEKQERIFAEALSASVSTLNSTLKFDEVLDRLLINLEKVIPNNHANIMLVDENNDARIVRARGYDAELLKKLLEQFNLHVDETPTLLRMSVTGEPLVIADTMTDPIWVKRVSSAWIRSYLGAPIHVKGKVVGYINLDSDQANMFNRIHTERLRLFADQAAIAIENARLFEQTEQMATIDYLTGLFNRRYFFELSETEFKRYKRYKKPFSLILLDLDHFKDINDHHGHAAGDQVLQNLATVFRESLRSMDIPGRIGGEEFVILLPETNQEQAVLVADRLRKDIEEAKLILGSSEISITASMGVVSASDEYPSLQAMILAADELMYRAKEEGRNRIVAAG